jgi:hypothetical protein
MILDLRVAILVGLIAIPALAADPPSIEKLIEQLGSRSFVEREKATKALRERGPEVLPALRKALESKDEEVRRRAETIIPPLEIEEALLPKRVTVTMNSRPLDELLKEIGKQTGCSLGLTTSSGTGGEKISLEVKGMPLWEVLERVGKDTGRAIEYHSFDKSMNLVPWNNGRSPFVNVRGPFRLEAQWFHEDRDIDFLRAKTGNEGARHHQLTLLVSVMAEPRITFLKVGPAKVEEAIDSEGKSLLEPTSPAGTGVLQPPGRGTFRGESLAASDIRLKRASETAKFAKLIRGTIPVKSILIRKPVVVTSKLMDSPGTSFKAGDEGLQITRVQNQGGNNVEVQIQVPYRTTATGRATSNGISGSTSRMMPATSSKTTAGAVRPTAGRITSRCTMARRTARRLVHRPS